MTARMKAWTVVYGCNDGTFGELLLQASTMALKLAKMQACRYGVELGCMIRGGSRNQRCIDCKHADIGLSLIVRRQDDRQIEEVS